MPDDWPLLTVLESLRGLKMLWDHDPAAVFHIGRQAAGLLKDRGLDMIIANPVGVKRRGDQFIVCYRGECKHYQFNDPLEEVLVK